MVEGDAVTVTDEARLQRLADECAAKYDQLFRFTVRAAAFYGKGSEGEVLVYELAPTAAFGFGKGTFSQTRWRFKRALAGSAHDPKKIRWMSSPRRTATLLRDQRNSVAILLAYVPARVLLTKDAEAREVGRLPAGPEIGRRRYSPRPPPG